MVYNCFSKKKTSGGVTTFANKYSIKNENMSNKN